MFTFVKFGKNFPRSILKFFEISRVQRGKFKNLKISPNFRDYAQNHEITSTNCSIKKLPPLMNLEKIA